MTLKVSVAAAARAVRKSNRPRGCRTAKPGSLPPARFPRTNEIGRLELIRILRLPAAPAELVKFPGGLWWSACSSAAWAEEEDQAVAVPAEAVPAVPAAVAAQAAAAQAAAARAAAVRAEAAQAEAVRAAVARAAAVAQAAVAQAAAAQAAAAQEAAEAAAVVQGLAVAAETRPG
jgi:hypothetical protein